MNREAALILLLICAVCGCPETPVLQHERGADSDFFSGTWVCENTTAVYSIECVSNEAYIEAWDSRDGERFIVTDVNLEESLLAATFEMPSTNHLTHGILSLVEENTMPETVTGDWEGVLIWHRSDEEPGESLESDAE